MNTLNFKTEIKNPLISFERANWWQARVNIIYIPFPHSKFENWYNTDQQFKQHYRTIIIPDKIQIGGLPVRKIQNYINELKKEVKGIRVEKIIKNNINTPVIVDLSPAAYMFWHMIKSRGIRYIAPDFFNFIHSIYNMLIAAKQLGAGETVVVLDFNDEYQELEKLLLYLKLNEYKIPVQIADRYVFLHFKNNYLAVTTDSSMQISKPIFNKLVKIISEKENDKTLNLLKQPADSDANEHILDVEKINSKLISDVLMKKFHKKIEDNLELESIVNLTRKFVADHPDIKVNLGDPNELANLVKEALKNEIKIDSAPRSFDDLIEEHRKQFVYKKNIDSDKIHNKKTIGINAIKATGVKWVTDPDRTKIEFDQNLDRNIEKLIESLDDPDFKMHVLGIEREIQDDGRSRYYVYKIKIKPEQGRAYVTKLKIPALIHGSYFKIGGNLYAINNQLMQLPIIKKNASTVQLKTNYSVTDYTIKSFPQTVKSFDDIVNKFLNSMKVARKLKTAEVMDQTTETRMREYGIPVDEISKINYKKIEVKG